MSQKQEISLLWSQWRMQAQHLRVGTHAPCKTITLILYRTDTALQPQKSLETRAKQVVAVGAPLAAHSLEKHPLFYTRAHVVPRAREIDAVCVIQFHPYVGQWRQSALIKQAGDSEKLCSARSKYCRLICDLVRKKNNSLWLERGFIY